MSVELSQAEARIIVEAIGYWLQHTDPDEIPDERRAQAQQVSAKVYPSAR